MDTGRNGSHAGRAAVTNGRQGENGDSGNRSDGSGRGVITAYAPGRFDHTLPVPMRYLYGAYAVPERIRRECAVSPWPPRYGSQSGRPPP